jgi:hypothetical protein
MTSKKQIMVCLAVLALGASLLATLPIQAQGGDRYKARLAPAPPLGLGRGGGGQTPASMVAGIGSATATLSGKKLTVNGTFEKMASAPTVAKIGLGIATGARLDLVHDLTLTKSATATPPGTSGTIAGTVELTQAQVDGLKKGKLYIQLNSESAPNGHLLGWLLK